MHTDMTARFHALITGISLILQAHAHSGRHGFIENKGQLRDQHGRPAPQVRYVWPTGQGMNVQVLANGLSYDTYTKSEGRGRFQRIDLRFIGASPAAEVVAAAPRSDRMHFIGRDGGRVRDVRHYDELRISELYPGVDLDLRIAGDGALKYDIVLSNGADLGKVRMRYDGHDALALRDGGLALAIGDRELTETIPASWTGADRMPVRVAYTVLEQHADHAVLGLKRLDPIESPRMVSLTVDPAVHFAWGTWFGGEGDDSVNAVDVDDVGMSYSTGRTAGFISTVTSGPHQNDFAGGDADAFLIKIAPHGSRLFATYFGGEGDDEGLGIDVDNYYRVRVVGRTTSVAGIASDSAAQSGNAGGDDAFIARFDSTGNLIWSTCIGGGLDDRALAVRAMAEGHAIVCGTTLSSDLLDTLGITPVQAHADSADAFALWIDDGGQVIKATFLGGEAGDALVAVALFPNSTAYLVGYTRSATGISDSTSLSGPRDGWICAVDTALNVLWSKYVGGAGDDALTGIARRSVDLVACGYASPPEPPDTVPSPINGTMDALILRLQPEGHIDSISHHGGMGMDRATGISSSTFGSYFVSGVREDFEFVQIDTVVVDTISPGEQAFLLGFSHAHALAFDRSHGGEAEEVANGVGAYASSYAMLGGSTRSITGIGSAGFQMSALGEEDGFVARFNTNFSTPCTGISNGGPDGPCQPGGCSAWSGNWCGGTSPPFPQTYYCQGDTLTFCASGGYLPLGYYWFWYADDCGNPQNFLQMGECVTIIAEESFTLWVRDEGPMETGHCTGLDVLVEPRPAVFANAPSHACAGESIQLNGGGGLSHAWSGPNGFAATEASTTAPTHGLSGVAHFIITAFSEHGCTSQDTAEVQIVALPALPHTASDVSCHGGSDGALEFDSLAAAPFAISWSNAAGNGPLIDGLMAGAYVATITDTLGCSRSDTLVVAEPPHPLDTLIVTTATCGLPNGAIDAQLIATAGPYIFIWYPEAGNGPSISGLGAGDYSAQYSNELDCVYFLNATVGDTGSIVLIADPTAVSIYLGDSTEIGASFSPFEAQASIAWSPADGLACSACPSTMAAPQAEQTYAVTVTNSLGCTSTDSVHVMVELPPEPAFYLPTHFSPNADGLNDRYEPLGGLYVRMRLVITDREGHEVFAGDGERPAWDGSLRGAPARQGVYTILLECERRNGSIDTHRAQLHLVR